MSTSPRNGSACSTEVFASPLGTIVVSIDGEGRLTGLEYTAEAVSPTPRARHEVVTAFDAYFRGDLDALDVVRTAAAGTAFQRRVWEALRRIPVGETASYADVAAEVGSPRAVRAVGRANATNPVGIVVPCHRVVRSDGSLGGYGGGVDRKRWLLRHEGAIAGGLAEHG